MVAIVVAPSPIILASTQPHVVIPIYYVFNFSCSIEVEQKFNHGFLYQKFLKYKKRYVSR